MRVLALRRRRPDVFATGSYVPLDAGPDVCAFTRGEDILVVVVVREGARRLQPPIVLPAGVWRAVLGGTELRGSLSASDLPSDGAWPALGLYERS